MEKQGVVQSSESDRYVHFTTKALCLPTSLVHDESNTDPIMSTHDNWPIHFPQPIFPRLCALATFYCPLIAFTDSCQLNLAMTAPHLR